MPRQVLILGGTTEGYALAEAVSALPGWQPLSSLAGRTARPRLPVGPCRIGGFGGVDGLAAFLRDSAPAAVIDATHPFARQMGWNAAAACAATGVPLLRLERPAWQPAPGDDWHSVSTWDQAAALLPRLGSRRVFLALGRQEVAAFTPVADCWFLIRAVETPTPLPPFPAARWLLARGPFGLAEETALLREHAIDTVVCKNSGGTATDAKLAAARTLGVRVVMQQRPPRPPDVPCRSSVAQALDWLSSLP